MKLTIYIILLTLIARVSYAQYFAISVKADSVPVEIINGTQQTFPVEIKPLNGFSASVNFSTINPCFRGTISLARTIVNPPYSGQKITVTPDRYCEPGLYNIIIKATNGPYIALDTLDVTVTDSLTSVPVKLFNHTNSGIRSRYFNKVFIDSSERIYLSSYHWYESSPNLMFGLNYYDKGWKRRLGDTLYSHNNCGEVEKKTYTVDFLSAIGNYSVYGVYKTNLFLSNANSVLEIDSENRIVNKFDNLPVTDFSMSVDNKGRVWLIGAEGVSRRENNTWITWKYGEDGFPKTKVLSIIQDSSSNFWLGSYNGLLKYDGKFWSVFSVSSGSLSSDYTSFVTIHNGLLYGVMGTGFFTLNKSYEFEEYNVDIPMSTESLKSMLVYESGDIFFISSSYGSPHTIYRYKNGSWYNYHGSNNPAFPVCNSVSMNDQTSDGLLVKDKNGMVWAAMNGCGLLRIDPLKLPAIITGQSPEESNSVPLAISPNPSDNGNFIIQSSKEVRTEVFDMEGSRILSVKGNKIAGLKKGFYIAKVKSDSKIKSFKLIVTQ